jgi:hypothetical protein
MVSPDPRPAPLSTTVRRSVQCSLVADPAAVEIRELTDENVRAESDVVDQPVGSVVRGSVRHARNIVAAGADPALDEELCKLERALGAHDVATDRDRERHTDIRSDCARC